MFILRFWNRYKTRYLTRAFIYPTSPCSGGHCATSTHLPNIAACGQSVPCGPGPTSGQISQRNPNTALLPGCVTAGALQHRATALSRYVHLRRLWHELLHVREAHGRPGRHVQFRDVWTQHDPAVPDLDIGGLG